MSYKTVFDLSQTGLIDWRAVAVCLTLVLGGVGGVVLRHKIAVWALWPKRVRHLAPGFAVLFLLLTLAISGDVFWSLIKGHRILVEQAASADSKVVEGLVREFVAAPAAGHADESFCVQDKCFSYSDYVLTGGFNTTSSHGGPIREGLLVRVTYVGDIITKLEIGDGTTR